ncbi:MAG: hypothetical protein IKN12_10275 [Selenomonadaceae bacterium]|nr:hypothetical protein [Selenomonadaceae bacterium]
MKKIFSLFAALLLTVAAVSVAGAAPRHSIDFSGKKIIKIAVVPYVNTSGETASYVFDSLRSGYTDYYANEGFRVVPTEDMEKALVEIEYNEFDNMLATESVLKKAAEKTKADIVIAMEIDEIDTFREDAFPKTKITAKVKLIYEIYKKSDDKFYQFKIATSYDNKATLAEVGPKHAVKTALEKALARGNHRVIEIINK